MLQFSNTILATGIGATAIASMLGLIGWDLTRPHDPLLSETDIALIQTELALPVSPKPGMKLVCARQRAVPLTLTNGSFSFAFPNQAAFVAFEATAQELNVKGKKRNGAECNPEELNADYVLDKLQTRNRGGYLSFAIPSNETNKQIALHLFDTYTINAKSFEAGNIRKTCKSLTYNNKTGLMEAGATDDCKASRPSYRAISPDSTLALICEGFEPEKQKNCHLSFAYKGWSVSVNNAMLNSGNWRSYHGTVSDWLRSRELYSFAQPNASPKNGCVQVSINGRSPVCLEIEK